MKKLLTSLKSGLSRAMFWRRQAPTEIAEVAPAAEEPSARAAPEVMAPPEPDSPAATDAQEVEQPRLVARFLALAAFWRRKPHAAEAVDAEAETQVDIPAALPADGTEPPPRRSAGKRLLAILMRKTVWLPTAAVLLLAVGASASVLFMRTQHAEQAQALRALQAEKMKLEQENLKLRSAPPPIPAAVAKRTPLAPAEPVRGNIDPAFDLGSSDRSMAAAEGDCLVTDKEKVGDSLRRCIESFNRATSGGSRKN